MEELKSIELIKNERLRQIQEEGYSCMHDDQWTAHQLSDAAIVYATPASLRREIMHKWHWDEKYFKPDSTNTYDGRIRELTKAGALICAEIDRLIRLKELIMARKEQIEQVAREYATHLTDTGEMDYHGHFEKEMKFNDDEYRVFIAGAEWADNNPKLPKE